MKFLHLKHIVCLLVCHCFYLQMVAQCSPNDPDCDSDGVCDMLDLCPNVNDALIGTACDDSDSCTLNDVWTNSCKCEGQIQPDSDNDGVCDAQDICSNFDDNMDIDKDGVPYCQDNCIDVNENGICDDVDQSAFSGELKIHFSHKRGHYSSPFSLELVANKPSADIRYEIGTYPDCPTINSGTIYNSPINISSSSTVTVKAIAYTATEASKVYTHTFLLDGKNKDAVVFTSSPYPVAPGEVELPISFEFIVPHGSALKSVQAYSGTATSSGGSSAGKSDKVFFRSDYETPTLKHDLFSDHYYGAEPVDKIDQLFLRDQHNDDSHLRQIIAHDASKAAAQLAPNSRFVNFYKNGQFIEIRQLQERPEGGFMESYTGIEKSNWEAISSHYNVPSTSPAYNSMITNASNWTDYKKYVNIESLSYFMISTWIANTIDYWDDKNFRAAGPADLSVADGEDFSWHFFMWDIDLGYDYVYHVPNGPSYPSAPTGWSSQWGFGPDFISPEYMLPDLNNHDEFRLDFADVIHCSMTNDGAFTEDAYLDRIWSRTNELYDIGKDRLYFGAQMDIWIPQRLTWLFAEMKTHQYYPDLDEVLFSHESGIVNSGTSIVLTNPNSIGEIYYTLDGTDVRLSDGTINPQATLYSSPIILPSGAHELFARVYDINAIDLVDKWSAHCEPKEYYVDQNYHDLVINEIHYNPADSIFYNPAISSMDTVSGRNFEFVELKNIGNTDIDLNHCVFKDGISLEFNKSFIVNPGGFIVLAEDSTWFHLKYGFAADFIYTGKLDNGGERLVFANPKSYYIDTMTYDDVTPWDETADLGLYSLALRTDAVNNSEPLSWEAQNVPTTPGAENIHCSELIILSNIEDESCPNSSDGSVILSVSNGTGPFDFQWSHGPLTDSIVGLSPATYFVDAVDLLTGCTGSDTIIISPALPPSPINLNLVTISDNSLIANWTMVPNNINYYVQYREVGVSAWSIYSTFGTAAILSNLDSCTDYEIRIGGDCSADGTSNFNPIMTFTTTGCFQCTSPIGLYQFNIQGFSAIITWDVLVGASSYTYKHRKVGDSNWNSQTTTFPIAVLFGISDCTDYEWTLETTCFDGSTAQSSSTNNFTTVCKDFSGRSFPRTDNLQLFPNPTNGNLNMIVPYNQEFIEMNIYNSTGQLVYNSTLRDVDKSKFIRVDIRDLSPGLYTISLGEFSSLFLKQ